MGKALTRGEFSSADYTRFSQRLRADLDALRLLLQRPRFGTSRPCLGAELEIYLIDSEGKPLARNREVLESAADPLLTLELNRFNLEYNAAPVPLADKPFLTLERSLLEALERVESHAARFEGRVVAIGILPTLAFSHFGDQAMTDELRYHVLKQRLRESRQGLFKVHITGAEDELLIETSDITFEGANTSFQVHYQVDPLEFASTYNAVQLVTPLVLACACNSPTAFGQRLWQETRIPLFKKSIDCRREELPASGRWVQPARVNFGHGWARRGAYELFAETVRLYPPLLPVLSEEDPLAMVAAGDTPELAELKLHQGTVWLWNRPVYDHSGDGHLRIEMRSLPSGPSVVDMVANAALHIGLAEGLKDVIDELLTGLPFSYAVHNFYQAARSGLDSRLIWPDLGTHALQDRPAIDILTELLPVAEQGLASIGIEEREIRKYLGLIDRRLRQRASGARWQLDCYETLRKKLNDNLALHTMLEFYYRQSRDNVPVSDWRLPD